MPRSDQAATHKRVSPDDTLATAVVAPPYTLDALAAVRDFEQIDGEIRTCGRSFSTSCQRLSVWVRTLSQQLAGVGFTKRQ